jgi:predicted metal-dependent peptidase
MPETTSAHSKLIAESRKALAETRAYVRRHAPYISRILYGLVPYFAPGFGTLAVTDRMVLIIDPEVFNPWPINVRGGAIFHECMHIAHGHAGQRARTKRITELMKDDQDSALTAIDLPINSEIRKVTHKQLIEGSMQEIRTWDLPEWACYPELYNLEEGLTAEQYYHLLRKQQQQKKGGGGGKKKKEGKGGGGKGSGKGKGKGKGKGGGGSSKKKGKGKGVGGGACGGCVGNPINPAVEAAANEAVGRTKADTQRIQRGAVRDIKEAKRKNAPGCGNMPASFENLLEFTGQEESKVPWRQRLSRVVRRATGRIQAGRQDYSLARPSKRSMTRDFIRPGLIDRKITILFVEDSSGSMGDEQLKAVRIEAGAVMQQLGIDDALFLDADADVKDEPRRVRIRDLRTLPVKGGGGTNFIPALARAQKLKPRPDIVMYLTDGDGPAPIHAPREFEVVWAVIPSQWCNRKPANWGHLIVCDDKMTEDDLRPPYGQTG